MKNQELASLFHRHAQLLMLAGENAFKVRAYERAALALDTLDEAIEDVAARGELLEIDGIGKNIAAHITAFLQGGTVPEFTALEQTFPVSLLEMMNVPGVGPRKAAVLFKKLHIANINDLERAARDGMIRELKGFGVKSEENILAGITLKKHSAGLILIHEAHAIVEFIRAALKTNTAVTRIEYAGSLRRGKETVGDIDILCTVVPGHEASVITQFTGLPMAERVMSSGATKASIITHHGVQIDLRVMATHQFGAALLYFTGSKEHNVALREVAIKKKLLLNEYGVFAATDKTNPIASATEHEIYQSLDMCYIPPELRENRGEVEAALTGPLPRLVELSDIKGDVHVHSTYSDGANSIKELALAAQELGYEWIIITDHSQSLKIAHGLSIGTLEKKIEEIRTINKELSGIRVLCGTEVDILADGSLDYPDHVLKELDFVIASIHSGFKQSEDHLTKRMIKAIEHPLVHCIGHPTGRLINHRAAYEINMLKVLHAAKHNETMIEINAFPDRLDLNDIYSRKAMELGVMLAIGSDSHATNQLGNMRFGVQVARRGWLEKHHVLNTISAAQLAKLL